MKESDKKAPELTKKEISLTELLTDNRAYVYPVLLYISGLFIGAFFYNAASPLNELLQPGGTLNEGSLTTLFINRFALYISVYAVTVLFGLCLIGFPFINVIPLIIGAAVSLKASCWYTAYPVKGIGYALLMLAPEASAFMTVLVYTIKQSRELSRHIYDLTVKKTDMPDGFSLAAYLKRLLLYVPLVAVISFVNAAAVYLLGTIIKM